MEGNNDTKQKNWDEHFRELAQPLVDYLRTHYHPHAMIIINSESAEILEGSYCEHFKM